jgi:hypothetical protein
LSVAMIDGRLGPGRSLKGLADILDDEETRVSPLRRLDVSEIEEGMARRLRS